MKMIIVTIILGIFALASLWANIVYRHSASFQRARWYSGVLALIFLVAVLGYQVIVSGVTPLVMPMAVMLLVVIGFMIHIYRQKNKDKHDLNNF
ncbi:hypothetical protein FC83_GL002877 [Agrilactobacillus composti DSM 18527 = JCM 14202]|uniref:Uncharacterized protein n=1 Tax=Agrilactobacillus composti DSM 18527 = JCM 14202 TaxID=1423734 RepID=X0PFX4_9LACO|nr:hypothetical protein [Agrilactobacillus composti]KRM33310.1 hypothetical protein FC83_GL002877 [Agrilactobacillus composti DSM 18527 = JCM 14202]GAF40718.1 hypothetical protein JCM14202_2624 [Agrilactobacillus composti DSM 18527 = JCM 14202]